MSRRRAHDDVRNETIVAERSGMLAHVARHRAGVLIAVQAGRLTSADADLVNRQVAAFAESCAIGLHIDGDTPNAVRDAMRPLVQALNDGGAING